MHKKSVVEQGVFHEFTFDNKALKHSTNFESVENFEDRTLSNSNSNFRHIPTFNDEETFVSTLNALLQCVSCCAVLCYIVLFEAILSYCAT